MGGQCTAEELNTLEEEAVLQRRIEVVFRLEALPEVERL